jgi:hypothetical protein
VEAFVESGMTFGPYSDDEFFYIEKSKMLKKCQGIKTVEFIFHPKKSLLYFVEAKSSSPKDAEDFAREIARKFTDSLQLFISGILKIKVGDDEIGENIKKLDYQKVKFRFFLIIQGHEELWLPPLRTEIEKNMRGFQTIWHSEVVVMNDSIAKEQGMIS